MPVFDKPALSGQPDPAPRKKSTTIRSAVAGFVGATGMVLTTQPLDTLKVLRTPIGTVLGDN